jgi:hypothetical protein
MEPVPVPMHLQTIVGQMDEIVVAFEGVLVGGCSYISLFVQQDLKLIRHQHPHPNIKLPPFIQQRPLNVFLHNPRLIRLPFVDKRVNFLERVENLDPAALIQARWLHESKFALAVLERE